MRRPTFDFRPRLIWSYARLGPHRWFAFLPWAALIPDLPRRIDVRRLIRALRPFDAGVPLIRVGPDEDGGYLVADDLEGVVACFSPGVGDSVGFEDGLASLGIPAFLMDATVEAPAHHSERFRAEMLGVATTVTTRSLGDWVDSDAGRDEGDLLLQMDIEGAEWDILESISTGLVERFRVIVVELHGVGRRIPRSELRRRTGIVEKLLDTHVVVNTHPNNCCGTRLVRGFRIPKVVEVSLLRRDRVRVLRPAPGPHPLERSNLPDFPVLELGKEWFGRGGIGSLRASRIP